MQNSSEIDLFLYNFTVKSVYLWKASISYFFLNWFVHSAEFTISHRKMFLNCFVLEASFCCIWTESLLLDFLNYLIFLLILVYKNRKTLEWEKVKIYYCCTYFHFSLINKSILKRNLKNSSLFQERSFFVGDNNLNFFLFLRLNAKNIPKYPHFYLFSTW